MDMTVQGGAEAVEEGDRAEPRLRGCRCVLGADYAGRVAEQSLDLVEEDRGESRDGPPKVASIWFEVGYREFF